MCVTYLDAVVAMDIDQEATPEEEVNMANAVDLSESESEEELEDIIDDFAQAQEQEEVRHTPFFHLCGIIGAHPMTGRKHPTRTTILLPVPRTLPCLPVPSCATRR